MELDFHDRLYAIDKSRKRTAIIKTLETNTQYYGLNGISKAIEAIQKGDFVIQDNDLIVGIDTFTIPHRYYDFFDK